MFSKIQQKIFKCYFTYSFFVFCLHFVFLHDSSDERMITHNLVDFLRPKLRSILPNDTLSLARYRQNEFDCCHNDIIYKPLSLVQQPKDPYKITKEPKEAIMVNFL